MSTTPTIVNCPDGTPLEFRWNDPAWAGLSFGLNAEHWVYPAPAMDIWFDPIAPSRAARAFEEVGLPMTVLAQFVGPFQFVAVRVPEGAVLETVMSSVGALMARYGSPLGFWREYCEPRARDAVAALEGPLRTAPLESVAQAMAYGLAQTFTSLVPVMAAAFPLRMMLEAKFGPEGAMLADEATQGGSNVSQVVDSELASLAATARGLPEVSRILLEESGDNRLERLRTEPTAGTFVSQFDRLIAAHRSRSFGWELLLPTWGEDPAAVLGMVSAIVRAGGNERLAESSDALREAARQRVRSELSGPERGQFEHFVTMLDGLVQIREDRAYWQMRLTGALRLLLLERGEQLVAAGRIGRADDIFHLTPTEFESDATTPLHGLAESRRAEWERFRTIPPPAFIGAPPEGPFPAASDSEVLRGLPCSRGVATGRARIIQSPDDFERFEVGDILVCRMTTPAWTPMFGIAAAVVAETGGPFSHPAITAREYGIPCVLGVDGAMARIADGSLITVDGIEGTVRLGTD